MDGLILSERIKDLKEKVLSNPRYVSMEQAKIITEVYKLNEDKPAVLKRARALCACLEKISIGIDPEELIVGNRTKDIRAGVVFPESGTEWVDRELETLPTRPQDRFQVRAEDISAFRNKIRPFWKGRSLEDAVKEEYGEEISQISKVVKINQKDHAQGHICPNCIRWLTCGPAGLKHQAERKMQETSGEKKVFYQSIAEIMNGVSVFMMRYHDLLDAEAERSQNAEYASDMRYAAEICGNISMRPAEGFHEAVQSLWFLFVILHMESNASSFSPGRLDRILYPYYKKDIESGKITEQRALDIIECLWIKFNEIVYMRNANSAKYFAGFPIGFNIAIGGQDEEGNDCCNELSFLFLKAQEHLGMPQPNLSLRLHKGTSDRLLHESIKVVARGSGMPQYFNDESVIPALTGIGIETEDARNYAIVGCVEVTTPGNNLGWSDAAMFNLNKALELTLNNGICLLSGEQIGPDFGSLKDYDTYEQLEDAFEKMIDYYISKMVRACEKVEKIHQDKLPSPFLSSVIDDCMEKGIDVTAGGARYNYSGIQMIQVANLADSLAAIKLLVYEEKRIGRSELLIAMRQNFRGHEVLRTMLLNRAPKYGNDVSWVDEIGAKWASIFRHKLSVYRNYRGGKYHTGMYTVSAHVPMGENVGASADGRYAGTPLADGGMSPVYGRDVNGPTAVLKSVSKIDSSLTSNGGLLNMKFLPEFFKTNSGIKKFGYFLRTFVDLEIPHIQFNVVRREDLIEAMNHPEKYRSLTVRVAGYTAYFTELAEELQKEIIARTSYGTI